MNKLFLVLNVLMKYDAGATIECVENKIHIHVSPAHVSTADASLLSALNCKILDNCSFTYST